MKLSTRKRATGLGALCALAFLGAAPAQAQLNGSHTLGDFGVQAGSQPGPGFYTALFYYHYDTDTIKDSSGRTARLAQNNPTSIGLTALAPMIWYVSNKKFLGANVGGMVVLPFANAALEAPAFSVGETIDTGVADLLIRPIDLGWHKSRADIAAGFQMYAPTGRYEQGGNDNLGKGMWTYEPFVGATVFFDEKKTFSLATTAFWEIHGSKKDSDTKVGQILSLEGGIGKSFLGGGLIIGGAYYAQWKLTEDRLRNFELPGGGAVGITLGHKHKVFGFGPDLTLPIATKKKLFALVNGRYFWETGAKSKTEGQSLIITATFPIPSVKLK